MLTPERLQTMPDSMVELWAQLEADILQDMAERIAAFDMYIPAAQQQAAVLREMGLMQDDITKRLSKLTKKSEAELKRIMQDATAESISADDKIYSDQGLAPTPIAQSDRLTEVLNAGLLATSNDFKNLTNTTAKTASQQFERALDQAYMQVASGAFSPGEAQRMAIKSLASQGVAAITFPGGRTDTIEVAVRRALITGVNQTSLKMQEARADEMDSDLVEVTAHAGARPDHAAWQGGIYSQGGKHDKYRGLREATGYGTGPGLGGWNCSHSFRPWFEGMPLTYSKKMLEEYEEKAYTYNGKKITEYEANQQQRYIERQVRRWKRENLAMKAGGQDAGESARKLAQWQATKKDFLTQTGLKQQAGREAVPGWNRSAAASATQAAKPKISTNPVVSTGSLNNLFPEDDIRAISAIIASCDPDCREAWNRVQSTVKVATITVEKNAFYRRNDGVHINLARDRTGDSGRHPYGVTFHEFGHAIDWEINGTGIPVSRTNDGALGLMLKKEASDRVKQIQRDLSEKAGNRMPIAQAYAELSEQIKSIPLVAQGDVSDMFEGATGARVMGWFGHGKAYWKGRDNGREGFAEMFDATVNNPESLEQIQKFFPESYNTFREILKEALK